MGYAVVIDAEFYKSAESGLCPRSRFFGRGRSRPIFRCGAPARPRDPYKRRGERQQALALGGRERQAGNELVEGLGVDSPAPSEILELLVGVGQAVAAHDGLNGLG